MPEPNNDQNRVIFGAEFDGQKVAQGVDEVINSLDKAREAEELLKTSIKENTAAMKENRKEAEKLAKSKPLDPKLVEQQAKALEKLNAEYDEMVQLNADLAVGIKKTKDIQKDFIKTQNEHTKSQEAVSKAAKKFTDTNELAADGVKKVGNYAKEAAFSFASGFAGALIGAALPAVVDFVSGLIGLDGALTDIQKDAALATEIQSKAAENYSKDVTRLELLRNAINDTNTKQSTRIKLVREYNKTAEEGNKIDETQLNNTKLVNEQIDKQIALIKQRALAKAAENVIAQKAEDLIKAQLALNEKNFTFDPNAALSNKRDQQQKKQLEDQANTIIENRKKLLGLTGKFNIDEVLGFANAPEEQIQQLAKNNNAFKLLLDKDTREKLKTIDASRSKIAFEAKKPNEAIKELFGQETLDDLFNNVNKAQEEFDRALRIGTQFIKAEDLLPAITKQNKGVENVFLQKLIELRSRLANAQATVFQSEGIIKKKFEEQLNKEFFEIGKLLKEKKLTVKQSDILKGVLQQINEVELGKSLEEFRKKREEALTKINDQIIAVQTENETKRINNLRDDFQREREAIDQAYDQAAQQINKRNEDFNKQIKEDTEKGLISPELAKRKKYIAAFLFGDLLNQAEQARLNAQADLAFKQFQKTLELAKNSFEDNLLADTEQATRAIREQVGLFLEGKISYEKYQKNLTEIVKRESRERRKVLLDEAEEQLRLIQKQIEITTDPKQLEQLEKQRDQLRAQIAQLRREIATGAADDKSNKEKERIDKLVQYVNAVNQLATAVLQFWQQVNQAEAAALDRSIALQNKRVENARQIAEAGNAEYLEMEQKRLDELERKREANARKQLAINNALATSQAIVAAISAIAQAVQSGSPLAAIAAVAAVVGAIGAAYQFVNSLQPQEANFFTGTEYVQGPEGRDKVKANLTKGERVVTAKDNKDYWDTLSAIHNRTIPPEVLNSFVETYPNSRVPLVDFERLSDATEGRIGGDSAELLGRVDDLNETMKRVVVGLDEMGINVNLDENGFEASISKARRRRLLRSRS